MSVITWHIKWVMFVESVFTPLTDNFGDLHDRLIAVSDLTLNPTNDPGVLNHVLVVSIDHYITDVRHVRIVSQCQLDASGVARVGNRAWQSIPISNRACPRAATFGRLLV